EKPTFYDKLCAWLEKSWLGWLLRPKREKWPPLCHPSVEMLETRWLPSQLSGITEYTVPTASSNPLNLTLGPDNLVWFTENASGINKIAKVSTSGTFNEYALNSGHTAPIDITKGPDGLLWFTEYHSTVGGLGKSTTSGSITDYDFSAGWASANYISSTVG